MKEREFFSGDVGDPEAEASIMADTEEMMDLIRSGSQYFMVVIDDKGQPLTGQTPIHGTGRLLSDESWQIVDTVLHGVMSGHGERMAYGVGADPDADLTVED
jgi:hypothetical protein